MPAYRTHGGLIALRAPGGLDTTDPEKLPERVLVLRWGRNETPEGPVFVGPKTLAMLSQNQGHAFADVALDFNHNTVPGAEAYQGEPAKIAAMGQPLVVEGEGLMLSGLKWTPEGRAMAAHYPDISGTVLTDENGEVIFIHSAALCRNGAAEGIHLFSATAPKGELANTLRVLAANKTTQSMIDKTLLKKLLKLHDDASEEDINKALAAALSATETNTEGSEELKALNATLATINDTLKAQGEQLRVLNAKNEAVERQRIIDAATAAGKVIPAECLPNEKGEGGLPLEALRTLAAALPVTVPIERRTPEYVRTLSAGVDASATQRDVMAKLGLTEDRWKAVNG